MTWSLLVNLHQSYILQFIQISDVVSASASSTELYLSDMVSANKSVFELHISDVVSASESASELYLRWSLLYTHQSYI